MLIQSRSSLKTIQDNIYKEHGLLILSIECRDAGDCVWISFRGISFALYTLKTESINDR